MSESISFTLNGKAVRIEADRERPLLWVLRTDFGLTGTKYGCGEGYCGACTVLVGDEAVKSCQTPLKSVQGRAVTTVEGLSAGGALHPLQQAFAERDALQCGYCTPGMIMAAAGLLKKKPRPTEREILDGLEDNICRCGSHTRIVLAVREAAERMAKGGLR